jgi:hypothetical protein
MRDWYPDAWEAVHGRTLSAAESFTRDRQQFACRHAKDWVVISAVRSSDHPGMVEALATVGGDRNSHETRRFLVRIGEYAAGRHGFVIVPAFHQEMAPAAFC